MKRKTTKEILAESFRELAEKKAVDKITIQEIVDNCDFSPATFYRHFRDKYDLIAWDYVHRTTVIMDKIGIDEYQWKHTLTDAMLFYTENRDYIHNLLNHTNGRDAFIRYMSEANVEHLEKYILKQTGEKTIDADTAVYVKIYVYGMAQTVCEWITGNLECDQKHLADLLEKALPEPLYPILFEK